jgi:hypothetical protein
MPPKSPDDELKLTRRLFLQHTAAAAAVASAGLASIALKTDALADVTPLTTFGDGRGDGMPYPYL